MTPRELAARLHHVEIADGIYSARCPVGTHAPARVHFSRNGSNRINLCCDDPSCTDELRATALGISVEELLTTVPSTIPREPVPIEPVEPAHTGNGHGTAGAGATSPSGAPILGEAETQQIALEAMLENFVNQGDVYGWLNTIREQNVPLNQRHAYYEQFLQLILTRDQADQDAIIHHGQPILHYRVETIRADLDRLRASSGDVVKAQPLVLGDDFIAEIIHVPGEVPPIKFLRYSFADGATEISDRIQIGPTTYVPPRVEHLVESGALVLPTGVEEYGDEATLLRDVLAFIASYVALDDPAFLKLAALYVLYTWVADRLKVAPYLHGVGDFSAGKSTFLAATGHLVCRGCFVGGAVTPAVLYRTIASCAPTLCIDEGDFDPRSDTWSMIRTILNLGTTPTVPILRMERTGDTWVVVAFSPFGPKIVATRKPFPDAALASRCLSHTFLPGPVPAHIPLLLDEDFYAQAASLRRRLLLWRCRNYRAISLNPREHLVGVEPRVNQAALALLAVARGDELREEIIAAAREYSRALRQSRAESFEGHVARALVEMWLRNHRAEQVTMKSVHQSVQSEHGDDITSERVSVIIRGPLGLRTRLRGGYSWVQTPDATIRALARRYDIEVPEAVPPRSEVQGDA